MVMTRSMAARKEAAARREAVRQRSRALLPLEALPDDLLIEIAGCVAATSPHPMQDVQSLGASCKLMRRLCKERAIGRRVALERENSWLHYDHYTSLVDNLATIGNPGACYVQGLPLVFSNPWSLLGIEHPSQLGMERLREAADGEHKLAAYVYAMLLYARRNKPEAERYIRLVEGENALTNEVCVRCREHAQQKIRAMHWYTGLAVGPVPAALDLQGCRVGGCGMRFNPWLNYRTFCSETCRIRHEYYEFFWRVSSPE